MQYGDFIAKSMLYDHLLETQQKTPDKAFFDKEKMLSLVPLTEMIIFKGD